MKKVAAWLFKSRARSFAWFLISALLTLGGALVTFDPDRADFPASLRPFAFVAFVIGLAGVAVFALRYWSSYFCRQLDPNFLPQQDGTYLGRYVHGPLRDIDVYRIDHATKERVLTWMVSGSVFNTAIFVAAVIGMAAVSSVSPATLPAIIVVVLILFVASFSIGRWAQRRAGTLMTTAGTLVTYEDWAKSPRPSVIANDNPRSLTIIMALIVIAGSATIGLFSFDSATGRFEFPHDGDSPTLIFLLVLLPAIGFGFGLWELRRRRRASK